MDIGRALNYTFEDQEGTNKGLITVIIGLIPLVNLAAIGWGLDLIRNMLDGATYPMPDWNDLGSQFVERWVSGLMIAIAAFIYYLPMLIINIILNGVLNGVFRVGSGDELSFLFGAGMCVSCITGLLGIVYQAVIWLPLSVGLMRYARTRNFGNFFDIGRNINLALENLSTMLVLALYWIVYSLVMFFIGLIPCVGWLIALASVGINVIVMGHLLGQAAIEIAAKTQQS
ncbi:MAG: DUF4013 domain-containing protein [Anaerolineae bacterium]|nr:DUF4013 domain-containing protein [Anaerolineae bacterium]